MTSRFGRIVGISWLAALLAAAGCDGGETGGNGGAGTTGTTSQGGGTSVTTGNGGNSGDGGSTTVTTGTGGTGGGTGGTGTGGTPMVCTPGTTEACYSGPAGTDGKGVCKAGTKTCVPDGSGFGPCEGEVVPKAEDCSTADDDDCDGTANEAEEGCVCTPGSTASCYSGPAGTDGIGVCVAGTKTCAPDGKAYGPCDGEVVPSPETCATPGDDDCDGLANEEGAGCGCKPGEVVSCYSGPPATKGVGPCKAGTQMCNAQGTGFGPCTGEVVPAIETCNTPEDDDCDGKVNEDGPGCVCTPNQMTACYTGPAGTQNVGLCKPGLALCNAQGTALGACMGEVLPAVETCNTPGDDDCDGQVNESGAGCVCLPGSTASCYSGPNGTQGVGLCKAGQKTCNAQGTGYGACVGEVVPAGSENCNTAGDDNCNGQANEGCAPAVTYTKDVQPIYQQHCGPCHTGNGSGGVNFGISYADTQKSSNVCFGKKVGECTLIRIQNGTMPPGGGSVSAAQQATIQAWITAGMPQ